MNWNKLKRLTVRKREPKKERAKKEKKKRKAALKLTPFIINPAKLFTEVAVPNIRMIILDILGPV